MPAVVAVVDIQAVAVVLVVQAAVEMVAEITLLIPVDPTPEAVAVVAMQTDNLLAAKAVVA
jgi:hypothetical protein